MARQRQSLFFLVLAALLSCCSQPAPAPGAAPPRTAKPGKPTAAHVEVRVAPEWKSRVPTIPATAVAQTLRQASEALARGQLEQGSSPGPGALELYLAVLSVEPANAEALAGLQASLDALLERGRLAMRAGQVGDAERVELIAHSLMPEHPDLTVYRKLLADTHAAERWVLKADEAGRKGRFVEPANDNVLLYVDRAKARFADFQPARTARMRWNTRVLAAAWGLARAEKFNDAQVQLARSAQLLPGGSDARVMALRIIELRQARTESLLAQGHAAVDRLRLGAADRALAHADRIAAQRSGVVALRQRIHLAKHYGPFKPGQIFSDRLHRGGLAPEMVVIPYGGFTMGSTDDDPQHGADELPSHAVDFKRGFAIARTETTVADFKRFVDASRYRSVATRAGHSTVYDEKGGVFSEHEGVDWRRDHVGRIASGALPVVHIALADAAAYAQWLSAQTGHHYRLPSEAEFEYVLRAGGNDLYPWGKAQPARIVGNLAGDGDLSRTGRNWGNAITGYRDAFWGPAPVRNFAVEEFGTYDMVGNVSEWTLDCWHDSYQRAPANGSAWLNPGCPQRVARGASWGSSLDQARSAARLPMSPDTSTARLGFRLVRDI